MARIFLDSSLKIVPTEQLGAAVETLFQQLEDQVNKGIDINALTDQDQKLPEGMRSGDLVINLQRGELSIGIFNGTDTVYASFGSFTGGITDAQHGPRAGGDLHPVATLLLAGFLSGSDKAKLDHAKGDTTAAGAASLTQFPNDGDWGWHTDTAGGTYKLAKNKGGTIFTVALT